jgi:hypothetical protein
VTASPLAVARELDLPIPGGQVTWDAVVDLAAAAYWTNRPRNSAGGGAEGEAAPPPAAKGAA